MKLASSPSSPPSRLCAPGAGAEGLHPGRARRAARAGRAVSRRRAVAGPDRRHLSRRRRRGRGVVARQSAPARRGRGARGRAGALGSGVKSLLAFPEVLARMDESPQWLRDLGEAFLAQQPHVMDTVQGLRRRAQANGQLATSNDTAVYQQGEAIVVAAAQPRSSTCATTTRSSSTARGGGRRYSPGVLAPVASAPGGRGARFFYSQPDWHHHYVRVVHRPVSRRTRTGRTSHPARRQHSPRPSSMRRRRSGSRPRPVRARARGAAQADRAVAAADAGGQRLLAHPAAARRAAQRAAARREPPPAGRSQPRAVAGARRAIARQRPAARRPSDRGGGHGEHAADRG